MPISQSIKLCASRRIAYSEAHHRMRSWTSCFCLISLENLTRDQSWSTCMFLFVTLFNLIVTSCLQIRTRPWSWRQQCICIHLQEFMMSSRNNTFRTFNTVKISNGLPGLRLCSHVTLLFKNWSFSERFMHESFLWMPFLFLPRHVARES
jgi:hypothetical protein